MKKQSKKREPSYQETLEQHSKALAKGEKARILWECFQESIGMTYENTFRETMDAMREVQADYETAVNFFGGLMKAQNEGKIGPKTDDVSVGHN